MWKLALVALTFDWSKFHPPSALLCVPAMTVSLAVGISSGHPRQGVAAAAGAFSVGFGSFQELRHSRHAPMFLAALGMCISSWVGTVAGFSSVATILVTALWGVFYGVLWSFSPGAVWIGLQCVVWLVISTAYPARGLNALTRGSLVLAGGLLQLLFVLTLWRIRGAATPVMTAPQTGTNGLLDGRSLRWQQRIRPLRAGVILAMAAALARWLGLPNSYWIPMTAAIVMKPDFRQTLERGIARIVGTLAGVALATLIAANLRPSPWILAALVVTFAWSSYLLIYVNYAAFAVCLTSYVVFLLSLAGLPENAVIAHRAVNTIVGGTFALIVHGIFSRWEEQQDLTGTVRSR